MNECGCVWKRKFAMNEVLWCCELKEMWFLVTLLVSTGHWFIDSRYWLLVVFFVPPSIEVVRQVRE